MQKEKLVFSIDKEMAKILRHKAFVNQVSLADVIRHGLLDSYPELTKSLKKKPKPA